MSQEKHRVGLPRLALAGLSVFFLIATACTPNRSGDSPTTSEAEPSALATSPVEAFCAGTAHGIQEFGGEIQDPSLQDFASNFEYEECLKEGEEVVRGIREIQEHPPETAEGWYLLGCYPLAAEFGRQIAPAEDPQFLQTVAIEACQTPFRIAEDLAVETAITPDGVCYFLDFEPTEEQIESGLVPCLSES